MNSRSISDLHFAIASSYDCNTDSEDEGSKQFRNRRDQKAAEKKRLDSLQMRGSEERTSATFCRDNEMNCLCVKK
jgi:hypothetical protein